MDCVFCQIIEGKISTEFLYQDSRVVVFRDINPAAPTHLLIVPKKHILSLAQLAETETAIIGHMVKIANRLARDGGIAESGYRLVINSGREGGQVVPHLHMHLLGGRRLTNGMG